MKALNNTLAATPPMGWSSWNHFKTEINETLIRETADALVSTGLAAAGYKYVNIDDCWQTERKNGKLVADPVKFSGGIKALADYVHSKGLKFGIYTCAGSKTCEGRPGSLGYEETDMATFAEWDIDFVKVDWCYADGLNAEAQYKKFRSGINKSGRPMILSICEWGKNYPWLWAKGVGELWRMSNDIEPNWEKVIRIADRNSGLFSFAGPGAWNDPDMLEVGNVGLSKIEQKSHFYLWAIMAAPLILGNDVRSISKDTLDLLTNPEVLAINQDTLGEQGRILFDLVLEAQIWHKPLVDGSHALLFINLSDQSKKVGASLAELNLPKNIKARDVGEGKNIVIENNISFDLAPHDSRIIIVSNST